MIRSIVKARWESGMTRLAQLPRRPMVAGAMSGVVSGVALGAFTGPIGVVVGMWMGVLVGFVTGYVLAHDDEKRSYRTHELDDIIGITRGSMGAGPLSTHPSVELDADADDGPDHEPYSSKEAWLSEWLTPPPPVVG